MIANRYDGIDLPDHACRVLILDGRPQGESIRDRYFQRSLGDTRTVAMATARAVEQGLGRSVRGEKDYSVILFTGPDLVRAVRTPILQQQLSQQTQKQIEIGKEAAELAKEELGTGEVSQDVVVNAFIGLVNQCLTRDEGWKSFYTNEMNGAPFLPSPPRSLLVFEAERKAELAFQQGDIDAAIGIVQALIEQSPQLDSMSRGWYLQEMARFEHLRSQLEANKRQIQAHTVNSFLLRPQNGMVIRKATLVAQRRVENIIAAIGEGDLPERVQNVVFVPVA